MKKLMTMIGAAVAAFGLYAADPVDFEANEVDFSGDELGPYDFPADPTFETQYWYFDGEVEGTVKEADSVKYLELDASTPVYRTTAGVDKTPDQVAIADAERGGIIFDQKVKFSAFDFETQVPEGLDTEGAKIAVWVKTVQEEDGETPAINHLMITTSKLNAELKPKSGDEVFTVDAGVIEVDEFHQLTITAIEAAVDGSDVVPGFKVALDEVELTCAEGLFPTGELDFGGAYTAEGADLIKVNKLFPSLIQYTFENAGTLQGVAFKGTGAIESIKIDSKGLYNLEVAITAPAGTKIVKVNDEDYTGGKVSITPGSDVKVELAADGAYVVKKPVQTIEGVDGDITADQFAEDTVVEAVAQIGDVYYETLAEAVAEAQDTDKVELLKGVTLVDTLVIDNAITLDLGDNEIKLAANKAIGIDVTAAATIQNGDITSALAANVAYSKAINIPNKNVTLTDVVIDAAHYEYAIYANCDDDCKEAGDKLDWFYTDTTDKFATLTCTGVSITGNGSLFHVEGMTATLNNCSATRDANELFANAAHQAAIYSAVNATTTIYGTGLYEHVNALQSGNLGGKIIVDAESTATFKGDIKSWMKVGAHTELEEIADYKASFTFNAGTYANGGIVFVDADARALDIFTKAAAVELDPPEGYQWNKTTGVLEPIPPEPTTIPLTITIAENVTKVFIKVGDADAAAYTENTVLNLDTGVAVVVTDVYYALGYMAADGSAKKETSIAALDAATTWAFEAKVTTGEDLPSDITPAEAGITNPTFADAQPAEVSKIVKWSVGKGGNINTAEFTDAGAAINEMADAYLLNCDPAQVEAAKAAFKFPAIEPGTIPTISGEFNGELKVFGCDDLANPTWSTATDANKFYKAQLLLK